MLKQRSEAEFYAVQQAYKTTTVSLDALAVRYIAYSLVNTKSKIVHEMCSVHLHPNESPCSCKSKALVCFYCWCWFPPAWTEFISPHRDSCCQVMLQPEQVPGQTCGDSDQQPRQQTCYAVLIKSFRRLNSTDDYPTMVSTCICGTCTRPLDVPPGSCTMMAKLTHYCTEHTLNST